MESDEIPPTTASFSGGQAAGRRAKKPPGRDRSTRFSLVSQKIHLTDAPRDIEAALPSGVLFGVV
jgi:hypothetical protein